MNEALLSSQSSEWETPSDLFEALDDIFHFDLDVCATAENAKCKRYFTKADNGLEQEWTGTCWMNPPYGREISAWVRKAFYQAKRGKTIVALLPARTDTKWWHDYCVSHEIIFLKGRVKFLQSKKQSFNAPFANAIVVFRPRIDW